MTSTRNLTAQPSTFWRFSAGALIASALAGCGGGGGSGGGTITNLSGAVIDGYINGATVCLDLNNNQSCDQGEPTAKSGVNGAYTLDVSAISADALKNAHLLTVVPTDAYDSDDGGSTLDKAGKKGFSMLAPVAAYVNSDNTLTKAVISPLTTLVSHDMIANNKAMEGAQNAVRSRLGLGHTVNLNQDFVAAKATDDSAKTLHTQAQVIAAALGQVQALIQENKGSAREAIMAAAQYAQDNALKLYKNADPKKSVSASINELMVSNLFKPNASELLAVARLTNNASAPSSIAKLLSEGVYLPNLLQENPPQYVKVSVADGKLTVNGFGLTNDRWEEGSGDGDPEFVLTKDGWKEDKGCENGSIEDKGPAKAELNCAYNSKATLSVRTLDVGAKSLDELGRVTPTGFESFKFPEGSKIHLTVFTNLTDEYQIWGKNPVTGPKNEGLTSISNLIAAYATPSSGSPGIRFKPYDYSSFSFTFDASTNPNSGTVSLWVACNALGSICDKPAGTATYEIKPVHGQNVLIVRAQPFDESPGNFFLFGVKDGNLYSGVYRPAFTGSVADEFLNKTAMDAILNTAKLPKIN